MAAANAGFKLFAKTKRSESGCLEWQGCLSASGYGRIGIEKKTFRVHRVAWEMVRGPIPEGMVIDHLCRNKKCCDPEHLEVVTQKENVRRGNSGKRNAEKTHCIHGHPFDEVNTYVSKTGSRQCLACTKARNREYARRKKENGG